MTTFIATALYTRPDTTSPFFYDYFGLASNPDHIRLVATAKQENKCYSDSWVTTPNGLIQLRVIIWVDRATYQTYYDDPWRTLYPKAVFDGYKYSADHGHTLATRGFDISDI